MFKSDRNTCSSNTHAKGRAGSKKTVQDDNIVSVSSVRLLVMAVVAVMMISGFLLVSTQDSDADNRDFSPEYQKVEYSTGYHYIYKYISGDCTIVYEYDEESNVTSFGPAYQQYNNTLTVYSNGGDGRMNDYDTYDGLPWLVEKRPTAMNIKEGVTHLGNNAFVDVCKTVGTINFPNSLESIGYDCFKRPIYSKVSSLSLTQINLPHVKSIGAGAFMGWSSLSNVNLGDSLETIGEDAFADCNISAIKLPSTLKTLGGFQGCHLTEVDIPAGVTAINGAAFAKNQIKSVTLPEGLTEIGYRAFDSCPISSVTIPKGVTVIGDYAFQGTNISEVKLPDGLKYLAGFGKTRITSIDIPSSVTTIGGWAFSESQIGSITIPAGVTKIGSGAFSKCPIKTFAMPDSVKIVEAKAFEGCKNLESVTFSKSLESIGDSAFAYCGLKTLNLPYGLKHIGTGAFSLDEKLTGTIYIPGSVKCVSDMTFFLSNNISCILMGEGVEEIGGWALVPLYLKAFNVPSTVKKVGDLRSGGSFLTSDFRTGYNSAEKISYDPENLKGKMWFVSDVTKKPVYEYLSNVNIVVKDSAEGITIIVEKTPGASNAVIGNMDFLADLTIQEIIIKDGITGIGANAFAGLKNLKSVEIPSTVTSIGDSAFKGCSQLSSVILGESVESIGSYAFAGCDSLKGIILPESLKKLGESTFGTSPLSYFTLPNSIETIDPVFLTFKWYDLNGKAVEPLVQNLKGRMWTADESSPTTLRMDTAGDSEIEITYEEPISSDLSPIQKAFMRLGTNFIEFVKREAPQLEFMVKPVYTVMNVIWAQA